MTPVIKYKITISHNYDEMEFEFYTINEAASFIATVLKHFKKDNHEIRTFVSLVEYEVEKEDNNEGNVN